MSTVHTPDEPAAAPVADGPELKGKARTIFHSLWASVFYSGHTRGRSVMVCSADRREGASTIACGLAVAGAEPGSGVRVALVDLNLRQPMLHRLLGVAEAPGVAEILTGRAEAPDCARTVREGLDFYPIGQVDGRTLDVLRSAGLEDFHTALVEGYDHVIADVASVNHYPDAQVLARHFRDAVFVAHTQQTPREALVQARRTLEAAGGNLAGLVLNLRTYPIPRFLYRRV